MGRALRLLAAQIRQPGTGPGHRHFCGLQFLGKAIRLDCIVTDRVANGRNLGLQRLQLPFGLGRAAARRRRLGAGPGHGLGLGGTVKATISRPPARAAKQD